MLEVNTPAGSIFLDKEFADLKKTDFEILKLSRTELEKRILRKKTSRGTDVGLRLQAGTKLRHGDIINNGDAKIIVEQLPEKIISVRIKTNNVVDVMVLLGHIIGNRHRPIAIKEGKVMFPIQSDSEKEVFTKLFHSIINHIEMTVEDRVFLPHTDADVHEH